MSGPADFTIPGAAPAAKPAMAHVIDVSEATFATEVVERSKQVPVVLDFWASWCGPCRQLSPILEKLAGEGNGTWVLAKIDVDANPALAQAAQVQGIPAVKAVVGGQIVGEFTGAMPEAQVRGWITELLSLAAATQSPGDAAPAGEDEPPAPAVPPALAAADDALSSGDVDGARAAFEAYLNENPADVAAKQGLAMTRLLQRAASYDAAALASATDEGIDVTLARADVELLDGRVDEAFARLIDLVRRTAGDEREAVRIRLVELFDVVPAEDSRLAPARRSLASALF